MEDTASWVTPIATMVAAIMIAANWARACRGGFWDFRRQFDLQGERRHRLEPDQFFYRPAAF